MAIGRRRSRAGVATLVSLALVAFGVVPLATGHGASPAAADETVPVPVVSERPGVTVTPDGPYRNVVVVLVDDMSTTLLESHPRLAAMAAGGVRFTDYVVTDSLCCTSRTSFLTGRFVHNHGVLSNMPRRNGGWPEFARIGWDDDNLGLWLQRAGIRTGYVGKYLNAYPSAAEPARIAKGWDDWFFPDARSYVQYGYSANDSGVVRQYGSAPEDYNTDVLAEQASEFIATSGDDPFFLTVAPFSPHLPATPPPRYATAFETATYPIKPSRNVQNPGEPRWLRRLPVRSLEQRQAYEAVWRDQLRASESIADLVDRVEGTLDVIGHRDDTLVVFVSDNGFHLDEHRLPMGKRTPYDEDVVVPFVLRNPRLAARSVPVPMSGVDLAPTVLDAFGVPLPPLLDGRSALDALSGEPWPRQVTYTEHLVAEVSRDDPDVDSGERVSVAFRSIRTPSWVYVEYESGEIQLFAASDTLRMRNLTPVAPAALLGALHTELTTMAACQADTCRVADVSLELPRVSVRKLTKAALDWQQRKAGRPRR